jgi:hypothetical protein
MLLKGSLTIQAGVVRLHVCFLHCTVLNQQSISLRAIATEDGSSIEGEVKRFGEAEAWVAQEANLTMLVFRNCMHVKEFVLAIEGSTYAAGP